MVELILCRLHFLGGIEPINKVGQKTYVQFLFGLELPASCQESWLEDFARWEWLQKLNPVKRNNSNVSLFDTGRLVLLALIIKNEFATINKKRVNQHILGGSKLILGEMLNNWGWMVTFLGSDNMFGHQTLVDEIWCNPLNRSSNVQPTSKAFCQNWKWTSPIFCEI